MTKNTTTINATLDNGKVLPLRQSIIPKTGEVVWAVLDFREDGSRFFNGWGVDVDSAVVGNSMPTTVTILGETFSLVPDLNKAGKPRVQSEKGTVVNVPHHGLKKFSLRITVMGQAQFSLAAKVTGDGNVKVKAPAANKFKSAV